MPNQQKSFASEEQALHLEEKRHGVRGFLHKVYKYRTYLLLLLPATVYTLVFCYYPMTGVVLAFKNYNFRDGIWGSPWCGFSNFEFFFKSGQAVTVIRNTVLYNITFIVVGVFLQVMVAVFLTEIRNRRYRKVSQSLMFLPYFISWVVVGVIAFNIFSSDYGFLNTLIVAFGGTKISFYSTPEAWPFIIVFFEVWKGIGYGSVVYLAAIMGVDTEIYEAAELDGCNVFQRIFKVTIPSIRPTIMIMVLMALGRVFKGNFDMFYNLTGDNGLLYNYTDVIDTLTMRTLINNNNYGMSAAIGLMQSVLCLITIIIANKLVRRYDPDSALF